MKLSLLAQITRTGALLPLLAYPAVLVANAMQLSARMEARKRGDNAAGSAPMRAFVVGTTIYPLVVLACRALADGASEEASELAWSAAPLAFLGVLAGLFAAWGKGASAG